MTTKDIEEIVDKFIVEFADHITANTPWGVQQIEDQMRDALTIMLTTAAKTDKQTTEV